MMIGLVIKEVPLEVREGGCVTPKKGERGG